MITQLQKHLGCISLIVCAFPLIGCDEGTIPAAPAKVIDAGADAQTIGDDASVIRTVETRNPFGDTTSPNNLMIDGDFELTGRSEQMPWITFTQTAGQTTLNYATGGKCKSGVRCASITAGTELIGYFASPKTGTMNASLWVRPDSGTCTDVQVLALDFSNPAGTTAAQLTVLNQDPTTGWCNFAGAIPNMAEQQPVLYVSPSDTMKGVALVDDGVILPADSTNSFTRTQITLTSHTREQVKFASDWVRTHRKF
jgi:hypothetical protein